MSSPIFVAIDTPDIDQAKKLAKAVKRHAGGLKLGLEFFAANGPEGVNEIAHLGMPVFLDLKLHDIPNTVAKAIHALRPLEPAVITVHGDADRTVPYPEAVRLHEALAKVNVPNQLVTVPGGGHGGFSAEERVRIYLAIREFLTRNRVMSK